MDANMFQMPFHDGRSFALFLKKKAREKGLSMYQLFEQGVVSESCYYKYLSNKREPKLSTVYAVLVELEGK